jgi:isopenicillin N synthase-like dioxygenase
MARRWSQPEKGIAVPYVPVVDISGDPDVIGAELDEICRTAGFFQITGHGIPDRVAEPAWTMATRFFDLPPEDKLTAARPAPDYSYGYIPLAGESLSQSMTGGPLAPSDVAAAPDLAAPPGVAAPPDLKEVFNMGPPVPPRHEFADPDEAWAYSPNLWPAALPELEAAWTVSARGHGARAAGDRRANPPPQRASGAGAALDRLGRHPGSDRVTFALCRL